MGDVQATNNVELIKKLPMPQDTSTLRSFLGLVGFLWDFIEDFALKAASLYCLLHKRVEWQWGKEECKAASQLKDSVISAPTLLYTDIMKLFIFELATTSISLRAVLSQDQGSGTHPVTYASHALCNTEKQYNPCEREIFRPGMGSAEREYLMGMASIILKMAHIPSQVCD